MLALITGISGQDGSWLAEHLLELGHEVAGVLRRNSTPEHQDSRIKHLESRILTEYGDLTDSSGIERIVVKYQPDQVYNLAAQSHVRISWDIPQYTSQVNAIGAMNVFEAVRKHVPWARVYQASSSEMFGNSVDEDGFQRLTTPMQPTSPYGIAKLFAFNTARHYRRAHKIHVCNGVLFNHESSRRASNFIIAKVVKAAVRIKAGKQQTLELGNIESYRDWGDARDYVHAMVTILEHDAPSDWIVATGQARSVKQMVEYVFGRMGLDVCKHVRTNDPQHVRPEELNYLCGDSTRTREVLGWTPQYTFEQMMDAIIDHWQRIENGSHL